MIKSLIIPIILIVAGLCMLPFFMIYGLPVIAVGIIWLAIAYFFWSSKKDVSKANL